MTLEQIQAAVKELTPIQQYEFSKWLLHEIPPEPLTEEMTDAIALERFRALDAEERHHAKGGTR